MPHDTTTVLGGLDPRVLERLAGAPAHWVDGGPISGWKPVHSRHAKTLAASGQRAKFVFTRIATPVADPVIEGWVRHQDSLVAPRRRTGDALVFWRLAVRQRAFAIDARPRADVATAVENTRRLPLKIGRLRVALAFLPGRLVPAWAVHDGVQPVFVGLPDHHLVPTEDVGESLAAIIALARWKSQVHDVIAAPFADAAS
ncbi:MULTISPECIES: hypothetical protein [unclassified Nocardioides]|uniref:hypothetical protein n=1 Tax=unclassified Nocardioides TaxID=2615069 RepID=UPI000703BC3A|nr:MULTISPECIES: hypothetical protein [unclassified Nocardioides]KRC59497.1 hypothetical protein ASE19_00180 [Nocardioides sp. Root79]KRC68679.1 hypothetical protein ASE20_17785 [Nocardioides sp. Root240]